MRFDMCLSPSQHWGASSENGRTFRRYREGLLASLLLAGVTAGAAQAAPDRGVPVKASPAASMIGTAEIVLPGFEPISWDHGRLALGAGRTYQWNRQLLPTSIGALGRPLAGPMTLQVHQNGQVRSLPPVALSVTANTGHHVQLVGSAAASDALMISAEVRVEYDGLATVELRLTPRGTVILEGLALEVPIVRSTDLRLLAYAPENIYEYGKQEVFPLCGEMPYKSVLGFADTERSFWVLTDEPAFPGPVQKRPPTTLNCGDKEVRVVQHLLGEQALTAPLTLRFAFLATPVRDLPPSVRTDRVVANVNQTEALLGNRHLWWLEALPHYALPYVDYPPGMRDRLTPAEQAAYPGLKANRKAILAWRSLGIERVPYMSLRVPSALEPVPVVERDRWQVHPPVVSIAPADAPYSQSFERHMMSHRAPGFSDYLVERLDSVLADLPVRGYYFDQAEPKGSANPLHLPADQRVRPPQASDILAMRQFFKRLATAIHQRGREPLIYVHNSAATVVPAYTFVTAMVQGEEFNSSLKGLNYLSSTNFEILQATYVSGQYGVPIIWLEEVWSDYLAGQRPARYRKDVAAWLESPQFEAAWRNFMAVALLHDAPVWTFAPPRLREQLYTQLDRFGVNRSRFTGYWQVDRGWRTSSVLFSIYTRDDGRRLAVVVNRSQSMRVISREDLAPLLGDDPEGAERILGKRVPAQDFALVQL